MRIFKVCFIIIAVCSFSASALAQQMMSNPLTQAIKPTDSSYGGAQNGKGSTPEEREAMRKEMSKMAIDRKTYIEQVMQGFDQMDVNRDGKLTAEEMSMIPPSNMGGALQRQPDASVAAKPTAAAASRKAVAPAPISGAPGGQVGIPPLNASELNK